MSMYTSSPEAREKLYTLINKIEFTMFTTVEADGSLHTRPMANQQADSKGDLWFFLERGGAAEANLRENPHVALGYSDPKAHSYVAISGKGRLVEDKAKIDELWTEDLKVWFPGGKEDPKIILIHVIPEKGEYWDSGSNTLVHLVGYIKAKLTGTSAEDLVEHEKVKL